LHTSSGRPALQKQKAFFRGWGLLLINPLAKPPPKPSNATPSAAYELPFYRHNSNYK